MKINVKRWFICGIVSAVLFAVWTALIMMVDVLPCGVNGTNIGLAAFNTWFHRLTGVHMTLYSITDWLGLVPIFICFVFGGIGLVQMIKRRSLFKVDGDILILGAFYVAVIFCYLIFEMIPINYRPVLIEGHMEASYPSSTTLLVLSVMPTLTEQANRRLKNAFAKRAISIFSICFSLFMVLGRMISGVHWFSDILGSVLISCSLFSFYKAAVDLSIKKRAEKEAVNGIQ